MYRRKSDGMWCAKVKDDLGYRVIYGKTQRELKEKLREKPDVTFGEVAQEWAEKHFPTLSPVTARGYDAALKRAVLALGNRDMSSLRPVDISRFLSNIVEKNDMAEKTAKTQLLVVHGICLFAVRQGYIDSDPSASVSIPQGLKHTRRELPSPADIKSIKESAEKPFGLFAMIALYTGLRRGEILALRKEDIDIEERVIYVNHSLRMDHSRILVKDPKTEAGTRIVGIPDDLLQYLENLPDGYIFQKKGNPLTESQYTRRWKAYVHKTGISCTPHQLRHAYTSALVASGLAPEEVQRLVGHAQISTTMDIYTHLRESRAKQIAEKSRNLNF